MRVLAITTSFTILSTLFVSIRLWTRFKLVRSPGLDDLFIFAALLCSFAFYGFMLAERHYGLGVSRQQLSDEVAANQMHYLWLSVPFYNLALILSKLSALFLFLRIFRSKPFIFITYALMGFLVIAGLWMVTSGFVFCIPVSDFWRAPPPVAVKHCLPKGPVWYSNAAMQIFSDVVILILPMPLLYKLQLPRPQKIGIMLVFGVGVLYVFSLALPFDSKRSVKLIIYLNQCNSNKLRPPLRTKYHGKRPRLHKNKRRCSRLVQPRIKRLNNLRLHGPLHPFISSIFSYFFRPQPIHSTPWSKTHSNATCVADSRKRSIYDHGLSSDGGIFSNDFFYAGPGGYTASISKLGDSEKDEKGNECEGQDGIRVVRELRMVSDSVMPSPKLSPRLLAADAERDIELGEVSASASGSGSAGTGAGASHGTWNPSIEWDLGDFEFPDYKERMNAPI
ncbi:hypothetical protein N7494_007986 [Penicillium frequentans]|uniref:Rhodopsin domain-containing protein n=1 Tax=Penicillium frequentans TaxID=3151616 RepID=A0AAD6CV48_9EURO|nr:hypothetical protein N7494_007986 [Penicillium glabrum]